MLRHERDRFLDDLTLNELEERLGVPAVPVDNDGAQLYGAMGVFAHHLLCQLADQRIGSLPGDSAQDAGRTGFRIVRERILELLPQQSGSTASWYSAQATTMGLRWSARSTISARSTPICKALPVCRSD